MSYILGISAFYHDSSAALIKDGVIISAVQEERFTRIKHDNKFPSNSIKFILKNSNLKLENISFVVFHEKPFLKFERLLETHIAFAPKGFKSFSSSMPIWLRDKLFQKKLILDQLKNIDKSFKDDNKLKFSEHHLSHAASAFYPSPFEEAIILTIDGVGEWATTTLSKGYKNNIEIMKEIHFPHSLGLLYSAFTFYLGFKVNSGEYKVMGLAPYGEPKFKEVIKKNLIDIKKDGSFRLNMDFFDYATGLKMINQKFETLFNRKRRHPEIENLDQFHMDIASSLQSLTEEIVLKICQDISKKYNKPNLCLAGGVALNCVANGKIIESELFKNVWIQPASGDSGCSLGAALAYWHNELQKNRLEPIEDKMKGSYLGPSFTNKEVKSKLDNIGAKYEFLDNEKLYETSSKLLSEGKAIGWFQGKMEYGPRALGNRSIIADPRSDTMQKNLNLKIKFRESFRPFAPSVLEDKAKDYFKTKQISPYMLITSKIEDSLKIQSQNKDLNLKGLKLIDQKRSKIQAVTHVDYSARVQTVSKKTNKKFYDLINKFYQLTDCPLLVNTSFNIRGEPIVCNPEDAFKCFMGTNLDVLIIENFLLIKEKQDDDKLINYQKQFELD